MEHRKIFSESLPSFILSFLIPFVPAGKACRFVYANELTAFGTSPFFFLTAYKVPDPRRMDHVEIFKHAHAIFFPVSFIQSFQSGAGKAATIFGAILAFASGIVFAVLENTGRPVFRLLTFMGLQTAATRTGVLITDIPPTKSAVHSAGSYQI